MRFNRLLILVAAFGIAGGSIAFTALYAARLHSDTYRREVERDVSAFFAMPTTIADVRGRTFDTRDFVDVAIRLPNDRDAIFQCDTATWVEEPGRRNYLVLRSGSLLLGDAVWENQQYRSLIPQDIGEELDEIQLRGIRLADFVIAFRKDEFALECSGAAGEIDLSNGDVGIARLTAHQLNGTPVPDGVRIVAEFTANRALEVSDIRLSVPSIPFPVLRLESFLRGPVTRGSFDGSIHYRIRGESGLPEAEVSGRVDDAELAELTRAAPYGPFEGNVSLHVEQARIVDRLLTHFKGRGAIRDLTFASFAPLLQMPALDGRASLHIDDVHIALGIVHRVKLTGSVEAVSLEQVLNRWAHGGATGTVTVRVNNFELAGETIRAADIEVLVTPPSDGNGYVERQLLLDVAEKALGFEWPTAVPKKILPERVNYLSIGAQLVVRDNKLRVRGTHGADGRAIVTIRDPLFGREVAVVKERPDVIDLEPYVRRAFDRMRSARPDDVRDWIDENRGAAKDEGD